MRRLAAFYATAGLAVSILYGCSSPAIADDAGKRDFPATLVVEEPQVETEFVPQVAHYGNANNARQTDLGSELSVQLTNPFAVVVHPVFTVLHPGGSGFQNLETTLKYQFIADPDREIVFSAGLSNEWSGIGARRVDADPFSTVTPTLFFGKGAGDLPETWSWARPFALTAQAGFIVPTASKSLANDAGPEDPFQPNPYRVGLQGSFQYNLVYASEYVPGLNVPKAFAALVPLVEYAFDIPVANNGAHLPAVGTINPGVLWCHGNIQIGLEAIVPINRDSGRHPGVRLQLAYAFDTPWIKHAESSDTNKDKD
jgi:hypothetical protein